MRALRSRARLAAGDEGLSLIEMVVAIFLCTLVLTGFVSVAIAGASSSRAADVRSRGNQLGNQTVEQLKGMSWTTLGLYDNDTGVSGATPTSTCGSETVVSLGATAPTPRTAPVFQESKRVNGRTFVITRCVTWRDDSADGLQAAGTETNSDQGKDIKHLAVTVKWTLLGKVRTLTFESLRSPTAVEVPPTTHSTATLALTAGTPSPTTQQLAADYSLSTPLTLSAAASISATSVTVTYTGRTGSVTKSLTSSDGGFAWSVTIPAGTSGGTFNPGTTSFAFAASSTSGSASATASVYFSSPPTPFEVTGTASPSNVTLTSTGYLGSAVTLAATTSVAATSVAVSFPVASGTQTRTLTSSNGGTTWSVVLPADATSGPYAATANELFTFTATGPTGSTTSTASISLTAATVQPVTVTSVVVQGYTGGFICKDTTGNDSGKSRAAQAVKITIQNVAATDVVTLNWDNPTGTAVSGGTGVLTSGSYVFTATIPIHTSFNGTSTVLTVSAKRAADPVSVQYTQTVVVQGQKQNVDCA